VRRSSFACELKPLREQIEAAYDAGVGLEQLTASRSGRN
jgi:hypothetical protein